MQLTLFHENLGNIGVKGLKELYINLINQTKQNYENVKKRNTGLSHLLNKFDIMMKNADPNMSVELFRLKNTV